MILPKQVCVTASVRRKMLRTSQILQNGGAKRGIDDVILGGAFFLLEYLRCDIVPQGQWAPLLREWTKMEQLEANEERRQHEEVMSVFKDACREVYPRIPRASVAESLQK